MALLLCLVPNTASGCSDRMTSFHWLFALCCCRVAGLAGPTGAVLPCSPWPLSLPTSDLRLFLVFRALITSHRNAWGIPDSSDAMLRLCGTKSHQHGQDLSDFLSALQWTGAAVPDVVRFPRTHLDVSTSPGSFRVWSAAEGWPKTLLLLTTQHWTNLLFPLLSNESSLYALFSFTLTLLSSLF